ncbi:hypothetical protein ASG87_09030 [Frateuria sp. Soil773]|uniref:DUF3011 domain-containing protein n=1 Tax=Frateuria sp. Soil773 TaxID=1736407 RepID=UPI0006FC0F85|nr:DUF3011 domain-containing protein [Frateuria sp. Soil773]KRE88707.1 hypothetical protein ASG87_09030 [Frateuria sp. Soil773]
MTLLAGMAFGLAGVLSLGLVPVTAQAQRNGPITCGSVNGRQAVCETGWRDAELIHQDSDTRCVRGQNWGVDRGTIWVDRGCRGQFVAAGRGGDWHGDRDRPGPGGWNPGPGWDRDIRLQCGSVNNRYRFCQVDIGRRGRVNLVRRESDARCEEGYSWGYNRAGVWVDKGCRAQFVVNRRG